jgi:hypothetical protein
MSKLDVLREQLKKELAVGRLREETLRTEIDDLYLAALMDCQKHVSVIASAAEDQASRQPEMASLVEEAKRVASTASGLSERVRFLDMTLKNLREAKTFVQGLDQLSEVDKRLASAMADSDIDRGAQIVASFHKFEKAGFASAIDHAVIKHYRASEAKLQAAVKSELVEAIAAKTPNRVDALTKTLIAIGMETEALTMYLDFVRGSFTERCSAHTTSIQGNSQTDRPVHVEAVTNIFLEVADSIQKHQKFVEEEFGSSQFIEFLLQIEYEANAHAVRVIRALMKSTTSAQSLVNKEASATAAATLDMCLEELVTIVMRCNRFSGYMHSLTAVENSSLQQVIEEVGGSYVAGEQSLVTTLVARAIEDDTVDIADTTSSVVDDCFFIFKKALDRALLTSDSNCACAVVNNISNLIQMDLKQFLEDSFETSKRLFGNYVQAMTPNRIPALDIIFKARQEEGGAGVTKIVRSGDSLPHAISNIAVTASYVSKFKTDCLESYDRALAKRSEKRAMFQQCLGSLDVAAGELGDVHMNSLKYLLQQLRGTFIHPFIASIDNVDFDVDEQGFADMQVNDPFVRAFMASLECVVKWAQEVTAPETAKPFLALLCDYLSLRMERSVLQSRSRFTLLGATQLYQDISRLVSFFAESTEVPVKLKFGRLQELCSILCLESLAEFRQLYGDGSALSQYKISNKEVRTILSLRSEFSHETIAATII